MHDVVAERRARQGAKQNRERHLCQAPFLGSPRAIARSVGGRRGIRTPGCLHINGFQDRRFRPLSQPSVISHCSALRTLVRPTVPKSLTIFIVTAERICLSNSFAAELPRYNRIITYAGSQDKDFAEFTSLMIAAVFDRQPKQIPIAKNIFQMTNICCNFARLML